MKIRGLGKKTNIKRGKNGSMSERVHKVLREREKMSKIVIIK